MPHTIWRSGQIAASLSRVIFAALLVAACSSKPSDDEVTVRTRGDDDPQLLQFASRRPSGNDGSCVWLMHYKAYIEAEYCGVHLSDGEDHNFQVVQSKLRRYFVANAKNPAWPLKWMEREKVALRDDLYGAPEALRPLICGFAPGEKQHVSELMLSKRVSDDIINQLNRHVEAFELACELTPQVGQAESPPP